MKYLKYFFPFFLISLSCSEGPFDPTYLGSGFKGITYTGEWSPDIIGEEDPSDWCYAKRTSFYKTEIDINVPVNFELFPAYPNPCKMGQSFRVEVAIPHEMYVELKVVDNNYKTVAGFTIEKKAAGVYLFEVNTEDLPGPGVYRVILETNNSYCKGDVWVQGN